MGKENSPTADDEALSAYLDGELSAAERVALELRLEREAALAQRLDTLRGTNEALRSAYGPIAEEPLPERVVDLLKRAAHERPAAGKVVGLARPPRTLRVFSVPAAMAASIALAAGVLLGTMITSPHPDAHSLLGAVSRDGGVENSTQLHELLHSQPSGAVRELSGGHAAMPRLSFLTADGTPCRQLDLASADGTLEVLACRHDQRWRIELVAFGPPPPAPANGVYRPASAPSSETMDSAVDVLIDGPPLGAEAEREWIARGWTQAR